MFNLSGSEIVFLLLLALIVLGPEKLPDAVRKFGKAYAEFKKMSTGFQSELKTALDEPMREMRETADAFKKAANFDFDTTSDDDAADEVVAPAANPEAITPDAVTPDAVTPAAPTPEIKNPVDSADSEPSTPTSEGNEPPLARPPGPTFHSAAPRPPKVVETIEETASE
ncbi:MAG: twin-arginine translocase TatA/TatE family subunit [Ilumatobacteraceae bacterium]